MKSGGNNFNEFPDN